MTEAEKVSMIVRALHDRWPFGGEPTPTWREIAEVAVAALASRDSQAPEEGTDG